MIWIAATSDLPIKTPEQLVTLASIIEKENRQARGRTRVAAVFVNRLPPEDERCNPIRPSSTGCVGGKGFSSGCRSMRSRDRATDALQLLCTFDVGCRRARSPQSRPAPRSKSAANPARTKELFFVADGTGGHAFADNYEQHQKNVDAAAV